jgi:ribosomal protein S18 acetylase RimI-like enzyme
MITERVVTTTYLEITDRAEIRAGRPAGAAFAIVRVDVPTPDLNRFLYIAVGGAWTWRDRLQWDTARWRQYVDRPELETWVLYVRGTPAGYAELERQDDDVELVYFGLLPAFIGMGLGAALLTYAIERGFDLGARRVWLHTCTLDHPQALANYIARGMRPYRTEQSSNPHEPASERADR